MTRFVFDTAGALPSGRAAAALSLILLAAMSTLGGCASGEADSGGGGSATGAVVQMGSGCDRDTLLNAVQDPARRAALDRGFTWLDRGVAYDQGSKDPESGYRQDCSGFVSMCWQLDQSYTTATLIDGVPGKVSLLNSYTDLQPGDALVRRSGEEGHAVMFVGWADPNDTGGDGVPRTACLLEQADHAENMVFGAADTQGRLNGEGFKPIRSDNLPAGNPSTIGYGNCTPDQNGYDQSQGQACQPNGNSGTDPGQYGQQCDPQSDPNCDPHSGAYGNGNGYGNGQQCSCQPEEGCCGQYLACIDGVCQQP